MSNATIALHRLAQAVDEVGHLLPGQGPITAFVHHNTLHAFEDRTFEEATETAGAVLGTRPYLPEADFRTLLAAGRIQYRDLEAVIGRHLSTRGADVLVPGIRRRELWQLQLEQDLYPPTDVRVSWLLSERRLLHRFAPSLGREARLRLLESTLEAEDHAEGQQDVEEQLLQELWKACLTATRPAGRQQESALLQSDADTPEATPTSFWGQDLLQAFTAAYLDQGLSDWRIPRQEKGVFHSFLALHQRGWCPDSRWSMLRREAQRLSNQDWTAEDYLLEQLASTPESLWSDRLFRVCTGLRGFAGMIRQLEEDPTRAPVEAPPCRLVDFLAVALLVDQASASLPPAIMAQELVPDPKETHARLALPLFLALQHLGHAAPWLRRRSLAEVSTLLEEIGKGHELLRRRLFQEAYERRYRKQALNALGQHPNSLSQRGATRWDVVLCLDEREESLRRHLEEADPDLRTFGTAGHFSVPLRYRGLGDAHWSNLAPPGQLPRFWIEEVARDHVAKVEHRHARSRRNLGRVRAATERGSHSLFLGALVHVLLGLWSTVPLVLEVLTPRLFHRLSSQGSRSWQPQLETALDLWQDEESAAPENTGQPKFTVATATDILFALLRGMGLTRPSRLVLLLGHGSRSLNNPQEAAHDCGACGGGRGGPNARTVAALANDPRVRTALAQRGLSLPAETIFLGGWHNTCDDAIVLFDLEDLPSTHSQDLKDLRLRLEQARRADAQERCRRFLSASATFTPDRALAHVEERAHDLAQPRPEYGHATNAMLMVGRRSRTRGLFLDRRVFLSSYDSTTDGDGSLLAAVLGTALPVCAGINLEYYFSFVDPVGYGCGTKLPHNICGLVGVMDGARSDLRTGLPWQMTEIHEPMRLLVVVEAPAEQLLAVIAANSALQRLVMGRWVQLAALSPDGSSVLVYEDGNFRPHLFEEEVLPTAASSWEVFHGRRGALRPARIHCPESRSEQMEAKA